jgi:hypothetical protein
MADERTDAEPTQPTQPKGTDRDGKPYEPAEIPVPKVSTFRAAIRKLAQPSNGEQRPPSMP